MMAAELTEGSRLTALTKVCVSKGSDCSGWLAVSGRGESGDEFERGNTLQVK